MGILDRFRKKKEERKTDTENTKTITELEQICGDDKETYEALHNTMFLDPRKITTSMKEAVENAKKFEKEKDFIRARTWYELAGGLAIYEGNVKKVVEYFSECEKLSPNTKYPILKNPEKAVAKAKEYYEKYLKA
ncbi:MAG: hypothetical protein QME50_05370 [Candidatus Bathyarchaeota archaeon]|nr:hypothetical protein [Candidatus Bathyarchaeota archaeon]